MAEIYAGLDVSDKTTHICAVDNDGKVAWRGVCATDPEVLAAQLKALGNYGGITVTGYQLRYSSALAAMPDHEYDKRHMGDRSHVMAQSELVAIGKENRPHRL